jgi:selenide,water dikinase
LKDLPFIADPNLIVGMEHGEDAGVYRLRDDLAIIQTVDFFTPIVDDPYLFGQIAVANALSDVYAMGGRPLTALNIVCFPIHKLDTAILKAILRGGLDKLREADVLLVGGHSVEDDETKYGLAVTGVVHPEKVLLNRGARPGDRLILTKPLGTGIVSTAIKGGVAAPELVDRALRTMTALNRRAAELLSAATEVHAVTDVTGFGLLGHALEMVEDGDAGLVIDAARVPVFPGLRDLVEGGIVPAGLHRNRQYRERQIEAADACPAWLLDVFFDPQTSGGLLVALPEKDAAAYLANLQANGLREAAVVGRVEASPRGRVLIR